MKPLVLVAVLLVGGLAFAAGAPKKKTTEEPADLPATARVVMLPEMRNHRIDMERLLRAVVLIEREEAAAIAKELSGEPRMARPLEKDAASLNSMVPPRFFELQDAFEVAARRLAEKAPKATPQQLGEAFNGVMKTCLACHAEFLNPPAKQAPAP